MNSATAPKGWSVLTTANLLGQVLEKRRATLDVVELEDAFEDLAFWSVAVAR